MVALWAVLLPLSLLTSGGAPPRPLLPASSPRTPAPSCSALPSVRCAATEEVEAVAALQLEVFVPEPEPVVLLPMLQQLFQASQQQQRRGMVLRLASDLRTRVDKGSDLLVAAVQLDPPLPDEDLASIGQYGEVGVKLLGTVDLSSQELLLPTHSLAGGLYLSHMADASPFRRQGLGLQLLLAAEEAAIGRGAEGIYLHVEPKNEAAISLYQQAGFSKQPPTDPSTVSFMKALNLEARQPLLMYKELGTRAAGGE